MKHYDLLIVGCGPVGGTLANLLRQKGHKVAIFDRDKDIFQAPRAMQTDAESSRIFQELGVQQRLIGKDARPAYRHIFVDEKRRPLMELNGESVPQPLGHAHGTRFHQPALEKLLRDDFQKAPGVDAYFGYEVLQVDGEGDVATLKARNVDTGEETEFSARYIVGADGGGSLCKKYIGGKRVDFNYSRRWIVMDLHIGDQALWDGLIDRSEFRCRPDAAVVFVKGCNNHVRFDFEVTDEVAAAFTKEDAIELVSEYFDPSSVEFWRIAPYHFYAGMPDKWRRGRVLIAGDAAHLTSPFSGQGLNMGIRDTGNLAFKLDLIFQGLASGKLLDTYQDERWDHCAKLIEGATARGLMISRKTFIGKMKRNLSFFIGQNFPNFAIRMTTKMSDHSGYSGGLLGDHALAGHQIIQPNIETLDGNQILLDDLTGNNFVLLQTSPVNSTHADWFETELGSPVLVMGRDFKDVNRKLAAYFNKHGVTQILVRPDRYIFDAGGDDVDLLAKLKAGLNVYR